MTPGLIARTARTPLRLQHDRPSLRVAWHTVAPVVFGVLLTLAGRFPGR